jgi:hypothetical protein
MTILIAGGGIGGLTLALSLHQIGVFESVSELKPLGVGINLLPHAVRELIELGLHDRLDAAGVRTRELAYFSKHGKPIWSEPRVLAKGATNDALVAYEAERRPATSDLVMLNRRNGPEQVMQLVEERAPNGYKVVTDVLSLKELEDIAANYKRVAGFQVEGLNAKPPIVQLPPARRASA